MVDSPRSNIEIGSCAKLGGWVDLYEAGATQQESKATNGVPEPDLNSPNVRTKDLTGVQYSRFHTSAQRFPVNSDSPRVPCTDVGRDTHSMRGNIAASCI